MMEPFGQDDPMLRPRNLKIQSVSEGDLDPDVREKLEILLQKKQ